MHLGIKALSTLAVAGLAAAAPRPDSSRDLGIASESGPSQTAGTDTATSTANALDHTATATNDVATAAATAKTLSPTSNVKGKAFDRILQVYLETTSFDDAVADPNCQALIKQGILLTENYGVGTPSQPNYISPASGDIFGLNSDSFVLVNKNVSTIVDLLEDKGISWGDYNEGLPYSGFDGFEYSNPSEGNYVRKHNLLMRFNSVADNVDRAAKVKNFTLFNEDLQNKRLPQWGFVTPNLYNNGHDTNISVSCNFTRSFVEPLLKDEYFNSGSDGKGKTLVYITWQANGQNPLARNHVAGILLGSAVPGEKRGTNDTAFYNHYSELSSVQANWGLHTLGRWDVGANVWSLVGSRTGDKIRAWNDTIAGDAFRNYYWNQSYGGVFSSAINTSHVYVRPNLGLVHNGRTVLPAVVRTWEFADAACRRVRSRDASRRPGMHGEEDHDDDREDDHDDDHEDYHEDGPSDDNKPTSTPSCSAGLGDYSYDGSKSGSGHGHHGGGGGYNGGGGGPRSQYCLPGYYRDIIEVPDAFHPPKGFEVPIGLEPAAPITTPITVYPF
ncbi:hypothetical protein RB595_003945 [Gaeumannomyces hyphopodioides]